MKNKISDMFNMMSGYGIKPVKSLGQNFLIDNNTIEKIINSADITKDDLVIEIGPGAGSMTKILAGRSGNLVAVEIDKKLIPLLNDLTGEFRNTEIINKDILKTDIKNDILDRYKQYKSYKVVANLPYYITTPIMMKFLESKNPPAQMTFMMQKEVADRINAEPGGKEYGSLTVATGYYCVVSKVMDVSPNCFYPRPDVSSTVLKLIIRDNPKVNPANEKLFFSLVRAAFAQRRKKVSNSIANTLGTGISREDVEKALLDMGLITDIRAEKMSIADFSELSGRLAKIVK